jgi:hypothetical protein
MSAYDTDKVAMIVRLRDEIDDLEKMEETLKNGIRELEDGDSRTVQEITVRTRRYFGASKRPTIEGEATVHRICHGLALQGTAKAMLAEIQERMAAAKLEMSGLLK